MVGEDITIALNLEEKLGLVIADFWTT